VQSVLIQEQALEASTSRVQELEDQLRAMEGGGESRGSRSGSFLGGAWNSGRRGEEPRPWAASSIEGDTQTVYALAQALDPQPHIQAISDVLLLTQPSLVLQYDDERVAEWLALYQAAPPWTNPGRLGQWSADLDWARDEARTERWARLTQRCLAVAFEHDLAWPPDRVREAVGIMPNAQFVEIGDAAHGGAVTHPDDVSAAVLQFFGESRN
jgi:pimeloyl-ACP methyl ester carboxylesterase